MTTMKHFSNNKTNHSITLNQEWIIVYAHEIIWRNHFFFRNIAFKKNPEYNLLIVSDLEHSAKHSQADLDLYYGPDSKDESKHIDLSVYMARKFPSYDKGTGELRARLRIPALVCCVLLIRLIFGFLRRTLIENLILLHENMFMYLLSF